MDRTVKERLLEFLDRRSIKVGAFERSIGAPNAYLKSVKNSPKKYLDVIYAKYPELNRVWLLSGEGHMLNDEEPSPEGEKREDIASEDITPYNNSRVHDLLGHISMLQDQLKKKDEQIEKLLNVLEYGTTNKLSGGVS